MAQIDVVFDKSLPMYACSPKYVCKVTFNQDPYVLTIKTPRGHSIYMPNIPECPSVKSAQNVTTMMSILDTLHSVTGMSFYFYSDKDRDFLPLIWTFIAKSPDVLSPNDFVICFYNPIQRKWSYVNRKRIPEVRALVELDIVNCALEYDLKQFPVMMFHHKLGRDLLELDMNAIADDAATTKSLDELTKKSAGTTETT